MPRTFAGNRRGRRRIGTTNAARIRSSAGDFRQFVENFRKGAVQNREATRCVPTIGPRQQARSRRGNVLTHTCSKTPGAPRRNMREAATAGQARAWSCDFPARFASTAVAPAASRRWTGPGGGVAPARCRKPLSVPVANGDVRRLPDGSTCGGSSGRVAVACDASPVALSAVLLSPRGCGIDARRMHPIPVPPVAEEPRFGRSALRACCLRAN